jgi:ribonuclease-3
LFNNHPEQEGILTSWRAALVRTESIGEAGQKLGYEPLVRMSRGEKQGGDRARQQILANAFEAVIGAIYLERGYDDAAVFIHKHIVSKLAGIRESGAWRDAKSHLQEVSQRVDSQTPQYRIIDEIGPDHDKIFKLGVYVNDKLLGTGSGPSKQIAQQQAASAALQTYAKRGKQIDVTPKTV